MKTAAWVSRMEQRRHLYASATGGSSIQRSDGAVADPPPGIAEQPLIFPFHRDATNSPNTRAPWQTGRTQYTRQNSPNKRRDTTVRLFTDNGQCRMPGPSSPPQSPCAGGLGDAGKAVHMDLLGERRQNGGDFSSRMNKQTFNLIVYGSNGNNSLLDGKN